MQLPELRMTFADRAGLARELDQNLRHGRAFLCQHTDIPVLSECVLVLIHPERAEELRLQAQVVMVNAAGVGLSLASGYSSELDRMLAFAEPGVEDERAEEHPPLTEAEPQALLVEDEALPYPSARPTYVPELRPSTAQDDTFDDAPLAAEGAEAWSTGASQTLVPGSAEDDASHDLPHVEELEPAQTDEAHHGDEPEWDAGDGGEPASSGWGEPETLRHKGVPGAAAVAAAYEPWRSETLDGAADGGETHELAAADSAPILEPAPGDTAPLMAAAPAAAYLEIGEPAPPADEASFADVEEALAADGVGSDAPAAQADEPAEPALPASDDAAEMARTDEVELDADALSPSGRPARPVELQQQESRQERLRHLNAAQQMKVARTGELADRIAVERLYGKQVWEALLHNPRLSIPEVARIARKGTVPKPLLDVILDNSAWIKADAVRRALLSNPKIGADAVLKLLRATPKHELKAIEKGTAYGAAVRESARKLLRQ